MVENCTLAFGNKIKYKRQTELTDEFRKAGGFKFSIQVSVTSVMNLWGKIMKQIPLIVS